MINLFTICNAHLDPIWLWQREEGMAEALSTFRVAADFCEKYDGFVFNHNESLLYEWVEEYEPELFGRIQALVKQGKWRIMGGWYLQPDCVMPCGESFIRQIETGSRYFKEKFGVKPETAVNFDPFGHTRGLVQILKKHGYKNYLFMRPFNTAPARDFIWKGFDGSEICCHSLRGGYSSTPGDMKRRIDRFLEEPQENMLMCWGIGDHGGGPSEIDYNDMREYAAEHPEIKMISSSCEEYFDSVCKTGLPVFDRSLTHCMVGCYTTMAQVKQRHRKLENELAVCEKMTAASSVDVNSKELEEAEKALLFSEFHDSLPGTMIKKAESQILQIQDHALEILKKYINKSFFKLCEGQPQAKKGEIPVEVFNPNPYKIKQDIEVEFQLESQNRRENEVTLAAVRSKNGDHLPTQNIKEECMLNMDWRKKIVFTAELGPMSVTRFDCELNVAPFPGRPVEKADENDSHIIFDNGTTHVEISKSTGLIDDYSVSGKRRLLENAAKICVFKDNEDPWAMETDGFYDKIGEFELLSDKEANEFNGFPAETTPNVRVIENGSVRMSIQAIFRCSKSYAVVTYNLPKNHDHIDISISVYSNDPNRMYKLCLPTAFENGRFTGQTAFGSEELLKENKEVSFQKWCRLSGESGSVDVINSGTYGGSCDGSAMYISLMRTPVYSAHPIDERQLADPSLNHAHIDIGLREFSFRIAADREFIDAEAEIYNQPVYALAFFPSGKGEIKDTRCALDNKNLILTRYGRSADGRMIAHIFNSAGTRQKGTFVSPYGTADVELNPFEYEEYTLNI